MTPPGPAPVIEIASLSKDYHSLRPLRIERLVVAERDCVAILGLDQPMAETLVNLVTGATLPDRGNVSVFDRSTSLIDDSTEWLRVVDRFGIVSGRAVLLDALSVIQNLAIPFTLDIDPPPDEVRARAARLAVEAGISEADCLRPVADLDETGRLRTRLARALALDPGVLLLEHPSAGVPRHAVAPLASRVREIAARRGCALLAATADEEFADAVATRVLRLDPASGRLSERRRRWPIVNVFRRRL